MYPDDSSMNLPPDEMEYYTCEIQKAKKQEGWITSMFWDLYDENNDNNSADIFGGNLDENEGDNNKGLTLTAKEILVLPLKTNGPNVKLCNSI